MLPLQIWGGISSELLFKWTGLDGTIEEKRTEWEEKVLGKAKTTKASTAF